MNRALIHWYWIMNWNWCFHSSAAGRVFSGEGDFDKLTTMNYAPNIGMQNWTRKIPEKGKSGTRKGEKCVFLCLPSSLFFRGKRTELKQREAHWAQRGQIIPDSFHRVLFEHALHMQPKRGRLNSESWPRAGNPGRDSRKTDCTETSILAPWIER